MTEVVIVPKAVKQFKTFPSKDQIKIQKKLLLLQKSPLEGKKLSGEYSELRSLRAWPYRIVYLLDMKKQKIFVITIAHRQGVYK